MSIDPKVIAFYLPQFHPIPENDEWWGPGFTEWTNSTKAGPLFDGHYQPRLPADLGFYDLRLREVRVRQAELARRYLLHGFCYYYYWFSGRKLLDHPISDLLESNQPDFPFCLCWANENWTRNWDGMNDHVLVRQNYEPGDPERLMRELAPFFADRRYIRIDGRPLFIVYRAQVIPEAAEVTAEWRRWARELGIGELHLCAALTFGQGDPRPLGFDSAVEFPPHGVRAAELDPQALGAVPGYAGKLYAYREVVLNALGRPPHPFKTFRAAMTAWDNTPRQGSRGHAFIEASPTDFEIWLRHLVAEARSTGDEFVFVNAWNEWGEGAYLEPDRHFGHRWLAAVRNAVSGRGSAEAALASLRLHAAGLPADAAEALDTLEAVMDGYRRTLAQAAGLLRRQSSFEQLFAPAHLSRVMPESMRQTPLLPTALGCIDEVNGQPAADGPVIAQAGDVLRLRGWLLAPGMEAAERDPLLVRVQDVDTGSDWFAVTGARRRREDVVREWTGRYPESQTRYSGFDFALNLTALPPGRYQLLIGAIGSDAIVHRGEPLPLAIVPGPAVAAR